MSNSRTAMHIDILPLGPLPTNAYLVTCAETHKAILIDPGWSDRAIEEAITAREAEVVLVVNTHTHWDHIGGNALAVRVTGAPLALHEEALPMLQAGGYADRMGLSLEPSPEVGRLLEIGEVLKVGTLRFKVLYTPGHAPGHISLYEEAHKAVFDGDVLFNKGVGRVDIPFGDWETLLHSIETQLLTLPDDVDVYPGHGPKTTIGEERKFNPFF